MTSSDGSLLMSLLPYLILSIPFAVGNYYLAPRGGKNRTLWVVLTLVPVVNFLFYVYVWYIVAICILDHLNKISARLNA
jgi:hypothetical protein